MLAKREEPELHLICRMYGLTDPSDQFSPWEPLLQNERGMPFISTLPVRFDRHNNSWFANVEGTKFEAVTREVYLSDIRHEVSLPGGVSKTLKPELIDLLRQSPVEILD